MRNSESLPEVRGRLVAGTDRELRGIERALHDGVQQDLVAVAVRLQIARRLADSDLPAALAELDEIGRDVRMALDRVQRLANEVYPSVLDARGLPDALRGAATTAGLAATIDASGIGRYPAAVEASVYFFCRAALKAAAEHAPDEARVAIQLAEGGGALRVVVDVQAAGGLGVAELLSSARDRIEALGGALGFELAARTARFVATVPLA